MQLIAFLVFHFFFSCFLAETSLESAVHSSTDPDLLPEKIKPESNFSRIFPKGFLYFRFIIIINDDL
ncbi:hypothetical protein MSBR3_0013 [Methanosarcina barkeri 3]|uniref:Uncharacterized protein n=2 Tax=Methanosarcina TaxID=2207 RepID=A0A0E3SH84_METBA|nr:hypothetical protein MSBR3_0013 [Methanosarcina barkeri 3]PAV12635.1 hypothetical protein ASJ81_06155 [Methanosarcina spelaei]